MSSIKFTESEINLMRLHYQQEFNELRKRLDEVSTILSKLGNAELPQSSVSEVIVAEIKASKIPAKRGPKPKITAGLDNSAPSTKASAKKSKRISWAKFVVKTLRNSPTPMSAPELLTAGSKQFSISDENRNSVMQSLQATLYRLKKEGQLDSQKEKGSYIAYLIKKRKSKANSDANVVAVEA